MRHRASIPRNTRHRPAVGRLDGVVLTEPTQRRRERRGLRLLPVGWVLAGVFTAALVVAGGVFTTGWELLDAQGLKPERRLDSSTLFDLVKLAFGVVAGASALVALVVAYRRQRIDEDAGLREATRLHTERFTTAVTQLGDDSPAVRLGGVHALAGLADDAPTRPLRQTCIDVLCAYLRLPYTPEDAIPEDDAEARHAYRALREVRHTVIRLIRDHLRLPGRDPHSWQGHDLDFTGVVFDGGDFSHAHFSSGTIDFSNAHFSSGRVSFRGAHFSGGEITYTGAHFSAGEITYTGVHFSGATVSFRGAHFSSATVSFRGAHFSAGPIGFDGAVSFDDAHFSGATVNFTGAYGSAPTHLLPIPGEQVRRGLTLPREWWSSEPPTRS